MRVKAARATIEIPWDSREALLGRLRAEGADALVRAFEAVGTSRPVPLGKAGARVLLGVVERWHDEQRAQLPAAIIELRDALIDERDAGLLEE